MENEVNLDEQMQLIDEAMENCQKHLQKKILLRARLKYTYLLDANSS